MQISESLISSRYVAGVMLAVAAVIAVVASTISMPGDRAFGQTTSMTNSQKVQSALDAFEAAVADPNFIADAAPPNPGGVVTQLVAAINTLETALTVDPTVTVDNLSGFNLEQLTPPETRTPLISVALTRVFSGSAGSPLAYLRGKLRSVRIDEFGGLRFADGVFTALKDTTFDQDGNSVTPELGLTDATKSALDALYESLLRGTADLTDLAAFRTLMEDALKADMNWYPNGFTSYPSGVTTRLNGMYDPAASPLNINSHDYSEGRALAWLQYARLVEPRGIAAMKKLLNAVEAALDDYEFTVLAEDADDAAKAARIVEEKALETARETVAPLIATLTADAEEFTAFDELAALETALKSVGVPSSGVTMKKLDAVETALLKWNLEDFDTDNDGTRDALIDGTATDRADQVSKLIDDSLTHIIAALDALSDLDGTDAQKAAIVDLHDLLTKVDDAVMKTMFTDTGNTP